MCYSIVKISPNGSFPLAAAESPTTRRAFCSWNSHSTD
jgi:hypothetical protein